MPRKKTRKTGFKDPHAKREASRYEQPIPSREAIMGLLDQRGELMKFSHLVDALELDGERDQEALRRRLAAMLRDGQLIQNRRGGYGISRKLDLKAGRVIGHPDGYGFVDLDEEGDDWYLSARQMRQVLHGDRVLVRAQSVDRRGRIEGAVVSILERANSHLVGRFHRESGVAFVVPDEKRVSQDVLIPPGHEKNASSGDFVYLEITEQPDRRRQPVGRVLEVLGRNINAPMATEVAIRNFDLPHQWPKALSAKDLKIPDHVQEDEMPGRKDLRQVPLVTIDGADARDFDDAVYCEQASRGGWKLLVAIADVSHYVRPGTAVDEEAYHRGTSVYFPNRVLPMLPEALSNGICSLNPAVDRLCMVCEMQVGEDGQVKRSRFYDAVMHSHARLTYEQAWAFLDGGGGKALEAPVQESLTRLYQVYQAFRSYRERRGAIDFRSREVGFRFDEQGEVAAIVPRSRNDAHRLIEECMIAANVAAARYLISRKVPVPFRVHASPPERKLDGLRDALMELGIYLPPGDDIKPERLSQVLRESRERPDRDLIEALILRSLSLAVYQTANAGHFGLALDAYAHFTSPIRRYPDLMVHRALRSTFKGDRRQSYAYSLEQAGKIAEHSSMTERRAEDASRDVDERLKCNYLLAHVGDDFAGTVTGVREFGLFVEIHDNQISGLVHVTMLPNDYYHFDPIAHTLTGEKRRRTYRLADQVQVQVIRVDVDDRQVDLKLVPRESGDESRQA
ncbi:MAG: ribonuclease R [Xanthomonadales bacterium]|nr:ribonuclease R [Xanthomonadales bacterium]